MNGAGLDILNTGRGHIEMSFDNKDQIELTRAKRIITDMLRRGYVLFLESPGKGKKKTLTRVQSFDATKGVYLIADLEEAAEIDASASVIPAKRAAGRPRREVAMTSTRATAIGRTSGG